MLTRVLALCLASWPALAQNQPLGVLPIETVRGGMAFLQGTLEDNRKIDFLVDTGAAGNLIDRAEASALRLAMGRGVASASGASRMDVGIVNDARLSVGPLEWHSRLVAADLSGLEPALGRPVKSILGGEFLSRYVVEWDYEQHLLRLYEPAYFTYRGGGTAFPATFIEGIPFVQLAVTLPNGKRIEGAFLVDTGAGGSAVQVWRPVAARAGAMDGLKLLAESGRGVGGTTAESVARGSAIELGRYRLERPVVTFTDDTSGPNSGKVSVGLIGTEVLSRFRMTLDSTRKRLYLEPSRGFNEPFVYDASGLRMRAGPPAFSPPVVSKIRESSPAEEAGIRVGDTVAGIDGQTTAGLSLEQVRDKLRKPGETHRLTLTRGGETIQVTLKTREILE